MSLFLHLVTIIVQMGCFLLLALTVLGLFGRFHWAVDILNHGRPYLLFSGMILLVLAAVLGLPTAAFGATIACLMNGYFVVPYLVPKFGSTPAEHSLTLMTANVYYSNKTPEKLLDVVAEHDPDILIVQEMSANNQKRAADLWSRFPHASTQPNGGQHEVILFSKIQLDSVKHINGDRPWRSEVEVEITLKNGRKICVVGIHPKAPMSSNRFGRRNAQLDSIAKRVSSYETSLIVAGDMNITPWSPIFRRFLRQANLTDGRRRHGFNMSWSSGNLPKILPIDQILMREMTADSFSTCENIGSDHLPVIAKLLIK